jgi:hypothetical protein
MTRKLESLFDLPSSDPEDNVVTPESQPTFPVLPETLDALDKIEAALPAVRGLEASDQEMDELAAKATKEFDNLMDLGMQVDSRFASEIFSVASQMLGHAITAKTAKMNKKLKMIDLQLKKAKLDKDEVNNNNIPTGQGAVIDRNELLSRLVDRTNTKTSDR